MPDRTRFDPLLTMYVGLDPNIRAIVRDTIAAASDDGAHSLARTLDVLGYAIAMVQTAQVEERHAAARAARNN